MNMLRASERVYRVLLTLYPRDFRREYGWQMLQVFRDVCRDALRQGGALALILWWGTALFDLLRTVVAEHRKVWITMFKITRESFIVWSGRSLMIAGACFILSALGQLQVYAAGAWIGAATVYMVSLGTILTAYGLYGVFVRFNAQLNLFGRVALLAAIIGAAAAAVGWALIVLVPDAYFGVLMAGWMLHLIGVSVFGGYAVTTHLLPRWNFSLLIGSALPLLIVLFIVQGVASAATQAIMTSDGITETTLYIFPGMLAADGVNLGAFAMLLLIGVGWLITGAALEKKSDAAAQALTA